MTFFFVIFNKNFTSNIVNIVLTFNFCYETAILKNIEKSIKSINIIFVHTNIVKKLSNICFYVFFVLLGVFTVFFLLFLNCLLAISYNVTNVLFCYIFYTFFNLPQSLLFSSLPRFFSFSFFLTM